MKNLFIALSLFLLSLTASAAAQKTAKADVWLEANPELKDKVKIELLMQAGNTPSAQTDYALVGLGDGLGVFKQGDETIVLMNHEIGAREGIVRAHGEKGAFVSQWRLDSKGQIISGVDLIQRVALYSSRTQQYGLALSPIENLCSADLPATSALFFQEQQQNYGTQTRIFFSGEEITTKSGQRYGRAFAHVVDGQFAHTSFDLPTLGKMAFENIVLSPYPQQQTIAMLSDDATNHTHKSAKDEAEVQALHQQPPSELYVYVGNKLAGENNPVIAAGLSNGVLYGIQVENMLAEDREQAVNNAKFSLVAMEEVVNDVDGKSLQVQSVNKGISQFLRIEDGAWNPLPNQQNQFFFVTTDQFGGNSRLYKLEFNDIRQPLQGGKISVVLNGNQHGIEMMDNITIDPWGRILIQEDPGHDRLAKIWLYDLNTQKLQWIAQHKTRYFSADLSNSEFISADEESTGIVQAFDSLGAGWYLLNIQAHRKHPNPAIIEHGQLVKLFVPQSW